MPALIPTLPRSLWLTILVPIGLVLCGTIGFYFLENDLSLFESWYLTVMTLTTVGFGDVVPKTQASRVFCMFLALGGIFSLFYAATSLIRAIISGELRDFMGRQQMQRTLAQMHHHILVCGYGRMGRLVCKEFSREGIPFVIIDKNGDAMRGFDLPHGVALVGDATSDETLRQAGIDRARGLVTVMASDSDNLFTTMSARLLNSKVFIVARVEGAPSEQKLLRAGANRVVSPYQIGGTRVAQAVLRPTVVDFIELATRTEHIDLQLEETCLAPGSSLIGANLIDSRLRADLRIIVVAIKKSVGKMLFNPPAETLLEMGDILVAIGHKEQLNQLHALADPQRAKS